MYTCLELYGQVFEKLCVFDYKYSISEKIIRILKLQ
jgi:hypothetical protein